MDADPWAVFSRASRGSRPLRSGPAKPPPVPGKFDNRGKQRQKDDDRDHDIDVSVDTGDGLPEEVAEGGHAHDPPNPSCDIIEDEPSVLHAPHSRHEGRERADYRHEASDDDGDPPVPIIELLGGDKVFLVEQERILSSEDFGSGSCPDGVADGISNNRRQADEEKDTPQAQVPSGRKQPRSNQKRIPRQEEADKETGLHKYDSDQGHEAADANQGFYIVNSVN